MLIDSDNHLGLVALLFSIVGVCCWAERFSWASRASAPVLIILVALVLSNLGLIPREAPSYSFVSEYFVMASIPLLLFKADLRMIIAETGRLLFAFLIAAGGTVLGVVTAFLLVPVGDVGAQAAAVITGGYTGGGMNFVAVSKVVGLEDPTRFAVVLGAEASVALSYLMMLSLMPAFAWFARWDASTASADAPPVQAERQTRADGPDLTHMGLSLGLSLAVCAVGVGLADLAGQSRFSILAITLIAIAVANLARGQDAGAERRLHTRDAAALRLLRGVRRRRRPGLHAAPGAAAHALRPGHHPGARSRRLRPRTPVRFQRAGSGHRLQCLCARAAHRGRARRSVRVA